MVGRARNWWRRWLPSCAQFFPLSGCFSAIGRARWIWQKVFHVVRKWPSDVVGWAWGKTRKIHNEHDMMECRERWRVATVHNIIKCLGTLSHPGFFRVFFEETWQDTSARCCSLSELLKNEDSTCHTEDDGKEKNPLIILEQRRH